MAVACFGGSDYESEGGASLFYCIKICLEHIRAILLSRDTLTGVLHVAYMHLIIPVSRLKYLVKDVFEGSTLKNWLGLLLVIIYIIVSMQVE